ncbi:MAG: ABC transporter permease [Dehalococcoidia bacterium]|nr:ABC transporter permease [Dehalococcoidia bacterium]
MSPRIVLATAERILRQLRRDRRSIAMILVVPPVLMALMKYVFDGQGGAFQRVGPPLLGLFPLTIMFLVTSIAMLRERTTGTLERLMSMPIAKLDLLLGYGLAFAILAAIQATVTSVVGFQLLGLEAQHPAWVIVLLAVGNAILGMSLGLFVSAFARSEFQAVQFMPAVIMPQFLLAGLMAPRSQMARPLEIVSDFLPLTYAYQALATAATHPTLDREFWRDASTVVLTTLVALVLAATTLRRRTD